MHPAASLVLAQSHLADLYADADRERRARAAGPRAHGDLVEITRLHLDPVAHDVQHNRNRYETSASAGSRWASRMRVSSSATIRTPSSISASDTVPYPKTSPSVPGPWAA